MGEFLTIRGKQLYIEEYGRQHEEVLLYLHGGPGASCLDFCHYQAMALSESVRVVAFDQRGVLRSEPIEENESFGLQDLILDCEAIREALGIEKWSILGHSFGGYLALKYVSEYPDAVKKVMYEAPCFDLTLSMKSLFQAAIKMLPSIGREELIQECQSYIDGDYTGIELSVKWGHFISKIGEYNKDLIYLHNITPDELSSIYNQKGIDNSFWARSEAHTLNLFKERLIEKSLLELLPNVQHETLLLHGKYDAVFCSEQLIKYMESSNGEVVIFEHSAHMPRLEEPKRYVEEVIRFIFK